jgi:hypothetical protein
MAPSAAAPEPSAVAPEPSVAPPAEPAKPAEPPVIPKPAKSVFDSLEEEMANLLGRPSGKS